MSANNQLILLERKKKFLAYDVCVEDTRPYDEQIKGLKPEFEAHTLYGAIALAQKYCLENEVEYNYLFVQL